MIVEGADEQVSVIAAAVFHAVGFRQSGWVVAAATDIDRDVLG